MRPIPKINLSLLAGASNVLDIPQGTVDGHKVPEDDVTQIMGSVALFVKKVGTHWSRKIVEKQLENNFQNIFSLRSNLLFVKSFIEVKYRAKKVRKEVKITFSL